LLHALLGLLLTKALLLPLHEVLELRVADSTAEAHGDSLAGSFLSELVAAVERQAFELAGSDRQGSPQDLGVSPLGHRHADALTNVLEGDVLLAFDAVLDGAAVFCARGPVTRKRNF